MVRLTCLLLLSFCLLALASEERQPEASESAFEPSESKEDESNDETDDKASELEPEKAEAEGEGDQPEDQNETSDVESTEETKEFSCNLKFKRVGCYADKSKKNKPLKSFIMTDEDLSTISKKGKISEADNFNVELPKFACKCANEAINAGNGIFGIQNVAECWTGPDSSKYDKDGESGDCVSYNYLPCAATDEVCAGKKHTNFVYYIDAPEHTKTAEEVKKELAKAASKAVKESKKIMKKLKTKESGKKKKSKKSKKSRKSKN